MIFSSSKKFIFFAVPKTGTHAVREAIRPSLGKDDWEQQALTGVMLSPVPQLAKIGHGHISYQQLAEVLTNEHIGSYFSFAVVRHPIDRFMSVCAFLARTDPSYNDNPVAWSQSAFQRARFRDRILVRPQVEMLTDDTGDIAISFIGRYETLQEDLNHILQRLDVPAAELARRNVTHNQKPKLRTDPGFIRDLNDFYADDFRLLGYSQN